MAEIAVPVFRGRGVVLAAGALAGLGAALTVVGLLTSPARALGAWLTAFAFTVSVALGALLFLLIGHAAGATWPTAIRRMTEAVAGAFPVLLVAFVPLVLGAEHVYQWAAPPPDLAEHTRALLEHKRPYLNIAGFTLRGALYFAIWIGTSWALLRWSFASDAGSGANEAPARAKVLSAAALPLVALSLTFASVDWLMSLEPEWYSSMFGVYYFAGGFVASLGLLSILCFALHRHPGLGATITTAHFHALGRLLLGFSIFWAYIAFFQVMLIQIADKPEEVPFYLRRVDGGWDVISALLVVGRFAVPFFALLSRSAKHNPAVVAGVGGVVLAFHFLDVLWLVAPALGDHPPWPGWMDLAALAAVAGAAVLFAAWRLRGRPVLPIGDPSLAAALAYRSPL